METVFIVYIWAILYDLKNGKVPLSLFVSAMHFVDHLHCTIWRAKLNRSWVEVYYLVLTVYKIPCHLLSNPPPSLTTGNEETIGREKKKAVNRMCMSRLTNISLIFAISPWLFTMVYFVLCTSQECVRVRDSNNRLQILIIQVLFTKLVWRVIENYRIPKLLKRTFRNDKVLVDAVSPLTWVSLNSII